MIDYVIIWVTISFPTSTEGTLCTLPEAQALVQTLPGEPEQSLPLAKPAGMLLSLFPLGRYSAYLTVNIEG